MLAESAAVLSLAILLDLAFGDPKNSIHPTAWIGRLVAKLAPMARGRSEALERLGGVCVVLVPGLVAVMLLILLDAGLDMLTGLVSVVATVIIIAVLLKTTLAVRGMQNHAMAVVYLLESGDLQAAREKLAMIVKRDTTHLDEQHVYSAVLESVSENTVDGVTGPLFYFGFFGIFGSFIYRIVNTADSMVGYRTSMFRNIGWFAATSDRVLNYIPSRLTGILMVFCSMLLRRNWRGSYHVMVQDGKKTSSPNAGYPMAAAAGALDAKLEKLGHYTIGCGTARITKDHVLAAVKLMKLTCVVFGIVVVVPAITVMHYVGWWAHA